MSGSGAQGLGATPVVEVEADRRSTPAHLPRTVCPHLSVEDARWRLAVASREHRCGAQAPEAAIPFDRQRRLCLGAAHVTCAMFAAAADARSAWRTIGVAPRAVPPAADLGSALGAQVGAGSDFNRWRLVRVSPVVAAPDRGHTIPSILRPRANLQVGLVGLLVIAFLVIAGSRPGAVHAPGALLAPTATPVVTAWGHQTDGPLPTPGSTATSVPVASVEATKTPESPAPAVLVYRVVSGDTLSGLAARFGTSVKAIMDLNGLTSTVLRIGQQLTIPPPLSPPGASPSTPAPSPPG